MQATGGTTVLERPAPDRIGLAAWRGPATMLLVLQVCLFAFLFAGIRGWVVALDHPVPVDYVSFYAAGLLADQGQAAAAYSRAAHFAMEQAVLAPGINYVFFLYPPPYLLICAVVAWLPWAASFVAFQAATLVGCIAVLRATLGERLRDCLVPLLAFPALPWVVLLGQNSFLTAGLFGGGLLLLERRPVIAGLLFAAMAGKPHFALLIPVALVAGGHWRAFAAAAGGVAILCALPALLFGIDIWPAYLASFASHQEEMRTGHIVPFGVLVTPFGALRAFGMPIGPAMLAQALASLAAALGVAYLWRKEEAMPLRAGGRGCAAMVGRPIWRFYDLMLALVALCWLVRHGQITGFPRGIRSLLVACWLLPLLTLVLFLLGSADRPALHGIDDLPTGALLGPAILLLCWYWRTAAAASRMRR